MVKSRFTCGDALTNLRHLSATMPGKFRTIILDPPYGISVENKVKRPEGGDYSGMAEYEWDKFDSPIHWLAFYQEVIALCKGLLAPDGTLWSCGTYHNIHLTGYALQVHQWWILNEVIWKKTNPVPNFMGVRFTAAHEVILWAKKEEKAPYVFNYQTMKERNGGKQMQDVWELPVCRGKERLTGEDGKILHPNQKPEEIIRRMVLASTNAGDWVLDPFAGTGTTGVVCEELGRHWLCIERDQRYATAAMNRIVNKRMEMRDARPVA